MSLDWPSAALRSFAFSLSAGRPSWARTWLCRQRIAARTRSRFWADGTMSVFWQATTWLILAFLDLAVCLAAALAFAGRLSPRAMVAMTLLSLERLLCLPAASAVGEAIRRLAATAAAGRMRVRLLSTSQSVGSNGGSASTRRAREHESFGSPAGSVSPVALRPALADGLPFREARTSLLPSSADPAKPSPSGIPAYNTAAILAVETGRGAACLARVLWEHEVAGSNPAAPISSRTRRGTGRLVEGAGRRLSGR